MLLMPISWIAIVLVASFFWRKRSHMLVGVAILMLFFFGNSFIIHEVARLWNTPITANNSLKKYPIGVVLGGYAYFSEKDDRVTFRASSDRLLQALNLLENHVFEKLILSGGSGYLLQPEMREAIYVSSFLSEMGYQTDQILVESESRNTHENAVYCKAILDRELHASDTVLLITSAYHMPRAMACFKKAGIAVVPFATDGFSNERMFTPDHLFLPQTESFMWWNIFLHEWVGYLGYWFAGYI